MGIEFGMDPSQQKRAGKDGWVSTGKDGWVSTSRAG